MNKETFFTFAFLMLCALVASADDLATGEWGFLPEQSGGGPAMIGQATADHLFVRNTYTDMGFEYQNDNVISFKGGATQKVWFWLDDSVMAADWRNLGLTPESADRYGDIMYNEITYNSLECVLYLPEGLELTYGLNRLGSNAKFDWGDRMPFASSLSSKKQEVKVIDGINYTPYKIVIKNNNVYGSHFSANDEFAYEENGALGRDDAALFALFIKNNNQEVAQAHMPDMIIANLEFGFCESAIANWEPNKCRYFYGTGGNNETQRFQLYHRVRLYGSSGIDDVQATAISLNLTSATVTESATMQLTATVLPTNATNRTVTWTSSNTSIATVSSSGVVTAIKPGSATITATTADGTNLSATCAVTVISQDPIISFADENVKALCVQKWDINNDGELSEAEAALVTDLLMIFKSNQTITSFNELQYFTGLESISAYEFYNCNALTSVIIPNSVTSIGGQAFYGCNSLTNVAISNSVTSIGSRAFYGCNSLTSMIIPNSVASIGSRAFGNCSGLISISVNSGNTNYDSRNNCNAIIETSTNTLIAGCMNTVIPSSVTSIGGFAFYGCYGLTDVDIHDSVTTIGQSAFAGCTGLTNITIPSSVTTIGNSAFNDCSELKDVYSHIVNPTAVTMGSSVFCLASNYYEDRTLQVPAGTATAYQADAKWSAFFGNIVEIPVLASSISLNKTSAELIEGTTLQLIAAVLPDNTTNKTFSWTTSNASIATVDVTGLITAVAPGSAIITVTTTDGTNLSATCAVTVKDQNSGYFFTLPDTTVQHGETIVIPVRLTNSEEIMAFQTDLFLPEDFNLVVDEDDEYMVTPSGRLSSDHILMTQDVSNGAVRLLCYAPNGTPFMGNEGDLFYLHIQVPDNAGGDYTLSLSNTLLTTSDYNELSIRDAAAVLTVNTFIPGDVNDSHTVTVTDIVATAQYIMELNPSPFIFAAADMNGDENISVTDIALIAYVVNHPTMSAPHRMPALTDGCDRMSGEGITLMAGETRTVSITLDNAMDYSAFQLDLMLPEGLTVSNFQLTDRAGSHALDVNALANGKTRVLCYSPAIAAIEGHSGALLTFDVTANAAIDSQIAVDGIELVTTDCRTVLLDGFAIGVNNATGVNMIDGSKTVSRIDYYNLAGQRVERPESGVTLKVTTYTDGTRTTTKVFQ